MHQSSNMVGREVKEGIIRVTREAYARHTSNTTTGRNKVKEMVDKKKGTMERRN